MPPASGARGDRPKLLDGGTNWPAVIAALDRAGYQGWGISEQPGNQAADVETASTGQIPKEFEPTIEPPGVRLLKPFHWRCWRLWFRNAYSSSSWLNIGCLAGLVKDRLASFLGAFTCVRVARTSLSQRQSHRLEHGSLRTR